MNKDRVLRFSPAERWAHWTLAVSFFLLLLTGLAVLSPTFAFLAVPFGGIQGARYVHRAAAVVFAVLPLAILVFGDRRALVRWLRDITTWGKEDVEFLKGFPREFFGGHPVLPEQGRFNAGEKVNSLLTIGGGVALTVSGVVMWAPEYFPAALAQWSYPLHELAALGMAAVIIGHMYLGLLHPGSKEAINGMLGGTVSREFAKSHHAKWYREVAK